MDRTPRDQSHQNGEPADGYIVAQALYTLPEFQRRLGLGDAAMRTARRQGLPVRRIGRQSYILGADAIDWLKRK